MQRSRLALVLVLIFGLAPLLLADSSVGGSWGERTDFPSIKNWETLRIGLTRTDCFGTCPFYTVEIQGDGTVRYEGRRRVLVSGKREAKISVQRARELFARFRVAQFFSLRDYYVAEITDNPAYAISIAFDGHRKTVGDYAGHLVGMPPVVSELEYAVDWYADSKRWVGSDWPIILPVPLYPKR
jgi:uncharacterized protein DUF6438